MSFNEQLNRIKDKLPKAKEIDKDFKVFGAESHHYQINSPITEEEIIQFEEKYQITLPEEYRSFLLMIGNGGAGPYYGIYKLGEEEFPDFSLLSLQCILFPNITKQEWEKNIYENEKDDNNENNLNYDRNFQGMLSIGHQGCTYYTMLIVSGKYKGRIVYVDTELQTPFFTYESNFLYWYERWLDEIIKQYDISWFGFLVGGDDEELIKKFHSSNDPAIQYEYIHSLIKLPILQPQTIEFLLLQSKNPDIKIKNQVLLLLIKYTYEESIPILKRELTEFNQETWLVIFQGLYWYKKEKSRDWSCYIKDNLRFITNDECFKFAIYILEICGQEFVHLLIPFFHNSNKYIKQTAIFYVGQSKNKRHYIEDLILCLKDEDLRIKHTTIQALKGIKELILLPYYEQIIDQIQSEKHNILTNILHNLKEYGKPVKYILEKVRKHPEQEIAKLADEILKTL